MFKLMSRYSVTRVIGNAAVAPDVACPRRFERKVVGWRGGALFSTEEKTPWRGRQPWASNKPYDSVPRRLPLNTVAGASELFVVSTRYKGRLEAVARRPADRQRGRRGPMGLQGRSQFCLRALQAERNTLEGCAWWVFRD